MKTSNILLLSLFGAILLSITIILVAFSSDVNAGNAPYAVSGNAEQIRTLPHFNKIEVERRFNVHFTQGATQKIMLKADSALLNLAVTEVRDGKLFLNSKKRLRNRQAIDVFITTDSINEVTASAGSKFETSGKIKAYQLDVTGNAGSVFQVTGEFTTVNLDFNAGSVGNFSGQCKNLGIKSNAGSMVDAGNLIAERGNVSSNAGAQVTINVTGELSVDANAGSIVKCLSNPQIKGINISSGAQFIK